nr:putative reverse transcriptase domain-containing protein [Tanacetum cinerariifolium]
MIKKSIDAAITVERARHANAGNDARGFRPVRGQDAAPAVQGKKVRFAVATLQGPALTWWNSKTATMGLKTVNRMSWTEMKQLMTAYFDVSKNGRAKSEKIKAYIRGLSDNVMGKVTSSRPANLNKANNQKQGNTRAMITTLTEGKVSSGSLPTCYDCGEQGHTRNRCPKKVKQEEMREVHGRAYAIKDAEPQGPNVVTGTFLPNNLYAYVLFDSGSDRSFMDTRFSSMLDIDPVKIDANYDVELADGSVVSTDM